jgi:hypothetical protein
MFAQPHFCIADSEQPKPEFVTPMRQVFDKRQCIHLQHVIRATKGPVIGKHPPCDDPMASRHIGRPSTDS